MTDRFQSFPEPAVGDLVALNHPIAGTTRAVVLAVLSEADFKVAPWYTAEGAREDMPFFVSLDGRNGTAIITRAWKTNRG